MTQAKTEKEKSFNLQSELRKVCSRYIRLTPNLPEHIKGNAIQILGLHIEIMGIELGALELIWRRERSKEESENDSDRN